MTDKKIEKIKDVKNLFSKEAIKILSDLANIVEERNKYLMKTSTNNDDTEKTSNDSKSNLKGRTPEHVKKKYKITIEGKERLVSDMDLKKMQNAKKCLDHFINNETSSTKKDPTKPKMEKELADIKNDKLISKKQRKE